MKAREGKEFEGAWSSLHAELAERAVERFRTEAGEGVRGFLVRLLSKLEVSGMRKSEVDRVRREVEGLVQGGLGLLPKHKTALNRVVRELGKAKGRKLEDEEEEEEETKEEEEVEPPQPPPTSATRRSARRRRAPMPAIEEDMDTSP